MALCERIVFLRSSVDAKYKHFIYPFPRKPGKYYTLIMFFFYSARFLNLYKTKRVHKTYCL